MELSFKIEPNLSNTLDFILNSKSYFISLAILTLLIVILEPQIIVVGKDVLDIIRASVLNISLLIISVSTQEKNLLFVQNRIVESDLPESKICEFTSGQGILPNMVNCDDFNQNSYICEIEQ